MRQAGRYLPEYRGTRAAAGSFLDLCYNPELATEVTLQPIRRFGFDAAILFSDILVVADALGQKVGFEEGRGPGAGAAAGRQGPGAAGRSASSIEHLAPVYETVRAVRAALPAETTLIGFAGAPWTVASYMIEGGSSRDFAKAKAWTYGRPQDFARLIDLLVDATSQYLIAQVEAGAEVLQLFDSWAGALAHNDMRAVSLEPTRQIVANVRAVHPEVPIILFPRGVGAGYLDFAEAGVFAAAQPRPERAAGLGARPAAAARRLQGNLDPQLLVTGGRAMRYGVGHILEPAGQGALHLQPRPRDRARDAARARGRAGEAGAGGGGMM